MMAEAMKLAYADRSRLSGRSRFRRRAGQGADLARPTPKAIRGQDRPATAPRPRPSQPRRPYALRERPDTTHFSVVDQAGNAVANTYTLNFGYGSGLVADGTGILLNNEIDDFSAKPGVANAYGLVGGDANAVGPGKRPLSSMSPTIVLKDGKPLLVPAARAARGSSRPCCRSS